MGPLTPYKEWIGRRLIEGSAGEAFEQKQKENGFEFTPRVSTGGLRASSKGARQERIQSIGYEFFKEQREGAKYPPTTKPNSEVV